jgi:uncharacterized protein YuzE
MKKSSKRFVVSTELKNQEGFKVRTAGIQLADYTVNPLMLWMHKRPTGESQEEILPIGYFVDLALEDGKLMGTPVFDDTDKFAMKIYKKVENGTIKMASAGLAPLSWTEDSEGVWLETSNLKEISLVDIGSNAEAIAIALYDKSDTLITLSLQTIQENLKSENMKIIQLKAPELLVKLNLAENATNDQVGTAIDTLITLAATNKTTIDTLKSEKTTAETNAADYKKKYDDGVALSAKTTIEAMVNLGFDEGRYTKDQVPNLITLAEKDFEGTKKVIGMMPANPDVMGTIKKPAADNKFVKLSYTELDKKGMLEELKKTDLPMFQLKFKEKFGKEYPTS